MKLTKPEMIIFDYGQTIADEAPFDGIKGTEALLKYAVENKYNAAAAEIQEEANRINRELGRFDPKTRHLFQVEVPSFMFNAYLYESMGVKLSVSGDDADKVFWDAAAPAKPADGIEELLEYLHKSAVRTGVISNISYSGNAVKDRISTLLPGNHFEFIIATSEYMFRKPNRRIFDLALQKSGLPAEDVWYCGDNFECDVIGSHNAGMFPVHYLKNPTKLQSSAADVDFDYLRINDWSEMIEVLETLK